MGRLGNSTQEDMESVVLVVAARHFADTIESNFVDVEDNIRLRLEADDFRRAATIALESYGPEVFGFLFTLMRNEDAAAEVFAQASEDLWKGIARFEGRASIRTWFYAIARNAAAHWRRSPHQRAGWRLSLSEAGEIAARVRTVTEPCLRDEVKDWFATVRNSLDADDRALLVLRVDRGMSWNEIARILAPDESSDEGAAKAAARMRKRFQLVKEAIRARAQESGLLPS